MILDQALDVVPVRGRGASIQQARGGKRLGTIANANYCCALCSLRPDPGKDFGVVRGCIAGTTT
jgi:hypothetical protein